MSDFAPAAISGFVLGLAFGLFVTWVGGSLAATSYWKSEIVERGLATYCPKNGEWAWIGECND